VHEGNRDYPLTDCYITKFMYRAGVVRAALIPLKPLQKYANLDEGFNFTAAKIIDHIAVGLPD